MLQRIVGLFKKDVIIGVNNYYVAVMLFTAFLFVIVINFVIPAEISTDPVVYYYAEPEAEKLFTPISQFMDSKSRVPSKEVLISKMEQNINSLGMIMKLRGQKPVVEYVLQGHEDEKMKNILALSIRSLFNEKEDQSFAIERVQLREANSNQNIAFNKLFLPLLILFEPALLGLILIATMIFLEKEEDTIQAFAVTPGRLSEFLVSKVLFILCLSIISATIITGLTVGFSGYFIYLLMIVAISSIFSSSLALFISSFFDTISKSMMWLIFISVALTIPMVSYFAPSVSPGWMKWLPTYPLLFAIKEAVFPTGNIDYVITTIWKFGLLSIVIFAVSVPLFKMRLAKD